MVEAEKLIMRTTLITLAGTRQGLVTTSLYAAVELRGELPDELLVVTTPSAAKVLLPKLAGKIVECATAWNFTPPRFHEQTSVIIARDVAADISDEGLFEFADTMTEIIRKFTADANSRVVVSIAGGRKTMSVTAAFAMSLFARSHDDMFHVVANEDLERSGFLYPVTPEEVAGVHAVSVPFIRLRSKLSAAGIDATLPFGELVRIAQSEVDDMLALPSLTLDCQTRTITIGEITIQMSPKIFTVYRFFAESAGPVRGGKHFSDSDAVRLWDIYCETSASDGNIERAIKAKRGNLKTGTAPMTFADDVQKQLTTIDRLIRGVLKDDTLADNYVVSAPRIYADKRYSIRLRRDKIHIINK